MYFLSLPKNDLDLRGMCLPLGHSYTFSDVILKHYIPNIKFWCETRLTLHFPDAMQHNFVFQFHTHSLEQHQLPTELTPYSPYVIKTSTESQLTQSSKGALHTLNHSTPSITSLKKFRRYSNQLFFQFDYSQSNHHKQDF